MDKCVRVCVCIMVYLPQGASVVLLQGVQAIKNPPANTGDRVWLLSWKDSLSRKWQPTRGFLPGKSHEQRNLVGNSPRGRKELDTTEYTHTHTHTHTHTIITSNKINNF